MENSIEASRGLLKEMISNNYHWFSERANLKKSGGVYIVDTVDLIASKVDTLAQRLDRLGTPYAGTSSSMVCAVGVICEICGIQRHMVADC